MLLEGRLPVLIALLVDTHHSTPPNVAIAKLASIQAQQGRDNVPRVTLATSRKRKLRNVLRAQRDNSVHLNLLTHACHVQRVAIMMSLVPLLARAVPRVR